MICPDYSLGGMGNLQSSHGIDSVPNFLPLTSSSNPVIKTWPLIKMKPETKKRSYITLEPHTYFPKFSPKKTLH